MNASVPPLPMLSAVLPLAMFALCVCLLACLVRVWRGPGLVDRVLALDLAWTYALALLLAAGLHQGSVLLLQAALLIALLGWVSTAAAARYLQRGRITG